VQPVRALEFRTVETDGAVLRMDNSHRHFLSLWSRIDPGEKRRALTA
jgi:hypothetical protein